MFGPEGTVPREGPEHLSDRREEMILDSSMVEHSAVNRVVVGSSPTRGAHMP